MKVIFQYKKAKINDDLMFQPLLAESFLEDKWQHNKYKQVNWFNRSSPTGGKIEKRAWQTEHRKNKWWTVDYKRLDKTNSRKREKNKLRGISVENNQRNILFGLCA